MKMEVQFEGILTKDEYLNLSKLATRPIFKKKGMFAFDLWLLFVVIGTIMFVASVWQFIAVRESITIWLFLFLVGLIVLVIGFKLRAAPHKTWEQNEVLRVHREGSITPEALEIRTLQGEWRLLWTDITGYGEYRDIVVLFLGPSAPIPFPRQFFRSQEEWDVFRAMVAENLELSHQVTSIEKSRILLFIIILVAILALVAQTITGS